MTAPAHPKAVVFDLDDTLFDCLRQCVGPAHREASKAMVEAGARATVDEVLEARLALAGVPGMDLDDAVAATFRSVSPVKVAEAGRRAFFDRDPGPLAPFPFVPEVLRRAREVARLVLLSTGHPATQRRKIAALGFEDAFDEVLINDAFDVFAGDALARPPAGPAKEEVLRRWLAGSGLAASDVLVVGDRADSEIAAALRLGMRALRIRGGEFAAAASPAGVADADDVRAVLPMLGIHADR